MDIIPIPSLGDRELEKLFPRRWLSGDMDNDEVIDMCNSQPLVVQTPTQAVIGLGWTPRRAARFIVDSTRALARPEAWVANGRTWIMSLHRTDTPSADAPLGLLGFRPELDYDPDRGPCLQFRLNVDLIWVTPAVRELGYGRHLVAHILRYLEAHPLPESHFGTALEGLEVMIARPTSPACRWIAMKLADSFEQDRFLTLAASSEGLPRPAWPVIAVNVADAD
jgi:GNAT superfamily N-acetyltransferase